jgi:hypothetical protein
MKTAADANMAYDRKMKAVGVLVKELEKQLLKHEGRQNGRSQDWTFVGDLEYLEEKLTEILRFIGSGRRL